MLGAAPRRLFDFTFVDVCEMPVREMPSTYAAIILTRAHACYAIRALIVCR